MRIAVIGLGYVGLCSGVGLALKGNEVVGVATTEEKAALINGGKIPIYEEALEESLKACLKGNSFRATSGLASAVASSSATFICVGTPSASDGSIDLAQMKSASESVGAALKKTGEYHVVVVKSTVIPGTTEDEIVPILERQSGKKSRKHFGVAMNPEFLREGKALSDFLHPDRVVVGTGDKKAAEMLRKVYADFGAPIIETGIREAEMIKYASNAFLATKISFINELGNLCKKLGIDTYKVAEGMGLDKRIGKHFLQAGIGWGGSCFPKDVKALIAKSREEGARMKIMEDVVDVNASQRKLVIEMLKKKVPLGGKKIAILGIAFKPGTDDMREAPAIDIIKHLQAEGALVQAYDPKAGDNARRLLLDVNCHASARDALKGADACLILTDWPEFAELTDKDFALMKNKIIIEGRRILDPKKVGGYEGICW
ncbi:MAG: UDP-glucose/GDP-mannose dehydrogenase family protein [Candidatus Aenigmarchaeota archaeon]|nr:UDP-glucose/GDP-mannose dehydrogenase family protein [Candidatus Aenigmarchaeota archaeon]